MTLLNLKKNSTNLEELQQAAEEATGGKKNYQDERMWKPSVNKDGNGFVELRFLPAPSGEKFPFTKYFDHGFKVGGRWFFFEKIIDLN